MDESDRLIDYTGRDPDRIWQDETGQYRSRLDEVSEPQRTYLLVWGLQGEVGNGGFEQFIGNSTGDTAELAVGALRSIGALACAEIAEHALRLVSPDPLPTDGEVRNALLGERFGEIYPRLRQLDRMFYRHPDDLTHLLYVFMRAHPKDFTLHS